MMKIRSALFLALVLTSTLFTFVSADVYVKADPADVSFSVDGAKPGTRISFQGDANGTFYFETAKGRAYIKGEPIETDNIKGGYYGEWMIQNHRISISVIPDDTNFTVRLTANPSGDVLAWGFSIKAESDEYFTGLMERIVDGHQRESWKTGQTRAMNLRGEKVEMIVKPTTSVYAPFYLSSAGYGIFVRTTWPGLYDFCNTAPDLVKIHFEGPSLDFRIYVNPQPSEIVKLHALEAGPPILPPKWAFTPWRWRDEHKNLPTYYDGTPVKAPYNSMVVEDILMMEALDIPCGVYWLDRPWCVGSYGYDDFEWDRERFPNPENMVKWLESRNTKLLLWIAPWVNGKMIDEVVAKNYRLPIENMKDTSRPLIDFTNPEARKYWQEQGLKKVLDIGIAGFKLDRGEENMPESRDLFAFDGRTTREIRNDYVKQYVEAAWEICKKIRGDDFILLPRAAFTGSSRYCALWGGDIDSSEWGLRASIVAAQRSAVMGYPYWGSDTGGYGGEVFHEVTKRWLAFSCFCPIMEVGPSRNKGLWDLTAEPHYDPELLAVWRLYAHIHNNLVDYSYDCAKTARATGMPIIRPLFMIFPGQKEAWEDWQTYLYGDDILVSAIWKTGTTEHTLYLPGGVDWIDAWTGKEHTGGKYVTVDAPVWKMPIFIRKGAKVKLGDLNAMWKESLARAEKRPNLAELQEKVK